MSKKNILFLKGIADNRTVSIITVYKDGNYDLLINGSANIYKYLQHDLLDKIEICLDTNSQQHIVLSNVHAIFNQISDADTHTITLLKAEEIQKKVMGKILFFNAPSNIRKTTRDTIYQLLHRINKLQVPKTVKLQPRSPSDIYNVIEKEDLKFPVIFRQAGDHGGISTIKVDNKKEQFYAFPLDGRDYYLTQFVDYKEDGIYAKYRLVVVDGEVFIRHVIFSNSWVIHSESRKYMEKNKEYQWQEVNILKSFNSKIKPKIQGIIDEVYQKLELDYFGIDCAIDKNFNIVLFEANANMNILIDRYGGEKSIWSTKVELIRDALVNMINKRLCS